MALGVDAGQTSTVAVLFTLDGRLLGVGHGGPANHVHEPGGRARLEMALRASIGNAFAAAGLEPETVHTACLGMTGGMKLVPAILPSIVAVERLRVEQDSSVALSGALAGEPGVVVISGTGSVALGLDAAGNRARAGGWAHIMGDEGSAYDLGRQALVAAARACDGRGPDTCLLQMVLGHFGMESLWQVRMAVYDGTIDRAAIARLAPLVVSAATAGDAVANAITNRGCLALAELVAAVARQLQMHDREVRVSYAGGVFRAGAPILEPFSAHLARLVPQATVRPPVFPPVVGAALEALRQAEVVLDDSMRDRLQSMAHIVQKKGES
ncbi:MAG: N-acetylglucosamine kinase [Anaerolineae bacterium]